MPNFELDRSHERMLEVPCGKIREIRADAFSPLDSLLFTYAQTVEINFLRMLHISRIHKRVRIIQPHALKPRSQRKRAPSGQLGALGFSREERRPTNRAQHLRKPIEIAGLAVGRKADCKQLFSAVSSASAQRLVSNNASRARR